jgi:hypothetical protein
MTGLRFADPETLTQYPLEISSTADWRPATDKSPDTWQFNIDLGNLPAGEMLAPSLSLLEAPGHRFLFAMEADGERHELAPIPPRKEDEAQRKAENRKARIRTAIDCFHIEKKVRRAQLCCELTTSVPPSRYLLTVSIRPTEIQVSPPGSLPRTISTCRLSSISQMLQNPRIASRACSPVATAMVMSAHRKGVVTERVIADCHDPVTGMYGLWPLAVRSAAGAGLIGAVELFADWPPVLDCLAAGLPLVASIRFGSGELPGAPMASTGGHLVVITGVDGDEVLVNDPAAPTHGTVSRRYPLDAFSRAWFRHRGAAYILCP